MLDRMPQDNRWGVLTGINYYGDPEVADLRFAVADARELYHVLTLPPYNFIPSQLVLLESTDPQNNQATRRHILRQLHRMAGQAQDSDWLLFYYSGHGEVLHNEPFLYPSDVETEGLLEDTAIPLARVRKIIEASAASAKVMIFDACHLGARLGTKAAAESARAFAEYAKQTFRDVRGIAMLASSSLEEISIEAGGHGIFTAFLLEALRNQHVTDHNRDAQLSVMEVFDYVATRLRSYGQQPTILLEGSGDIALFPLPQRPSPANPVRRVFPSPVKDPVDFFGRAEELRRVQETLLNTSDILILVRGERCIGKTSFLNRVKTLLDAESGPDARFLHFSIEPSSIQTVEDFARELWDGLMRLARMVMPSDFAQEQPFSFASYTRFGFELAELLNSLRTYRFVVFVDEFEKLRQATDAVTADRIVGLLRYIIEQTGLPIAFVISSLEDLNQIWSSFGSPPTTLDIVLAPLDRGDCDAMLSSFFGSDVQEKEQLLEYIYLVSGGHPYFAKLLAAAIFDDNVGQKTCEPALAAFPDWDKILAQVVKTPEATNIFTSLYKRFSDEERFVLLSLAGQDDHALAGQEVGRWPVSRRVAARRLEQKHYLLPLADGGYRLRLPLLGRWLREWHELALERERLGLAYETLPAVAEEGICIDEANGKVYLNGRPIESELPHLQYRALFYLARNAGRVISRDELYQALHSENEAYIPTDQSLDALIYRLRLALGDREQRYLKTLRKRGYLLTQGAVIGRS